MIMQFERGLIRIGPFNVDAVQADAVQAGYLTFVLSQHGVIDRDSFFAAVRRVLPLEPPVPTSAWDPLPDSLWQGLYDLPEKRIAILWANTGPMARTSPSDFEIALDVLYQLVIQLADELPTVGQPKNVLVIVE